MELDEEKIKELAELSKKVTLSDRINSNIHSLEQRYPGDMVATWEIWGPGVAPFIPERIGYLTGTYRDAIFTSIRHSDFWIEEEIKCGSISPIVEGLHVAQPKFRKTFLDAINEVIEPKLKGYFNETANEETL